MRNQEAIRERYLRDALPVQLGGLAANLARIASFLTLPDNRELVAGLLEESTFFIEWTAPDADLETQATLVELQIQLALAHYRWLEHPPTPEEQAKLAEQACAWSETSLALSGLL
ncbi:MAG: hypothetical protein HY709_08570 [Candidatus Latescibacteria bacterium]|nr:hypothetical protein [Candidatus Latescibacterota bacterium]